MAKLCCSIEMEPRTLNPGQMNHAREMAADVAQKMEASEASAIFIEGMGLISGVGIKELMDELKLAEEEKGMGVEETHVENCNQKAQSNTNIVERPCQCSCDCSNSMESPDPNIINLKEPVTAPF